MQPTPAATRRVRDWTRAALAAEAGAPWVVDPGDEGAADQLAAVRRQRVAPVLAAAVSADVLPPAVALGVSATLDAIRPRLLAQVLELRRVGEAFDGAGVPWLAVKGPALAVQTTGHVAARGHGDVDVLVDPATVGTAYAVLHDLGWTARPVGSGVPGSWAWRHIVGTFHEMTFDGPGSTVDLHWRLDPTYDALPDFAHAWGRRAAVDVAGTTVQTLGLADAFLHTCHHAMRDDWRWLRSLVDVHRLARHDEVWSQPHLSPTVRAALAVVDHCVGLPAAVPRGLRPAATDPRSRHLRRAVTAQGRAPVAEFPFPAAQTVRDTRYRVMASRSPADLRRTAVTVLLPAKSVSGLDDASAWTAVPRLLARRVTWLARRFRGWARREPGAAVADRATWSR